MKELTDAARANLASGADTGPGTSVCAGCLGEKEASRLNSAKCKACGKGVGVSTSPSPVRVIRAVLDPDVAARFDAEARAKGITSNVLLAQLVTTRDAKKYGATPVAPTDQQEDA